MYIWSFLYIMYLSDIYLQDCSIYLRISLLFPPSSRYCSLLQIRIAGGNRQLLPGNLPFLQNG
jgi:hypothetical protein